MLLYSVFILLIRDMVVERWNRRFGCETIHPTQKFTSMNLLQMPCVITWAWSFLTSEVVETVRGQKHHISTHTLAFDSMFSASHSANSAYQRFKKWDQLWLSASISRILEPSPQGLFFSFIYCDECIINLTFLKIMWGRTISFKSIFLKQEKNTFECL